MAAFGKRQFQSNPVAPVPPGATLRGSVPCVTNLPYKGENGDCYVVAGADVYIYGGLGWVRVAGPATHTGANGKLSASWAGDDSTQVMKLPKESKLTWKGISVILVHEDDITELFESQYNLTREDMALFQMTYPDLFKEFRQRWAEKWAIETAKDEFDSWGDDYYEKKRRRNYQ